ncbi:MAG: hypothetical protein EBT50_02370 [Verrucomicrobia bacterium]|nr:hypothetical protein [Verrucomicrobiota bacterium]
MFSPVHIVGGLALAKVVPGGEIPVFAAAVLSHLALDAIPHGDTGIGHWVHSSPDRKTKLSRLLPMSIADQVIALIVFLILIRSPAFAPVPLPLLLAGAIGSMFPDYLTGFRDLCKKAPPWLETLHRLHERCHFRGNDPFSTRGGLIFQTVLVFAAIILSWR